MKKILLTLALLSTVAISSNAAEKYATVNVDYVMSKYPAAQQATDWLRKEELSIQQFVLKAKQDIEQTPEAQKKAKEEKYNKELQTKAMNLRKQEEAKGKEIYSKFDAAVKTTAKAGGYTLVIPAALYGATDISDTVLKNLK
ncbi:OmpH family outer membrane protein [bacterium]|nr:OmpH family outer membrane protein [bacterium]